jgi:hypothetical protein
VSLFHLLKSRQIFVVVWIQPSPLTEYKGSCRTVSGVSGIRSRKTNLISVSSPYYVLHPYTRSCIPMYLKMFIQLWSRDSAPSYKTHKIELGIYSIERITLLAGNRHRISLIALPSVYTGAYGAQKIRLTAGSSLLVQSPWERGALSD